MTANGKQYPWERFYCGEGLDAADSPEARDRQGSQFDAVPSQAGRRRDQAEAGAHRLVGSVRRLDAVGLDALDLRAVRVSVRGGVSAYARRRESVGKFDVLFRRRRHSGRATARRAAAADSVASRRPRRSRRISRLAGRVTVSKTVPQLKKFLENGGTILTIGSSTALAITSACPSRRARGAVERRVAAAAAREFYVPGRSSRRGSTTRIRSRRDGRARDVFFDESPVFRSRRTRPEGVSRSRGSTARRRCAAAGRGARSISIGGVAVAEANVGKGKLFLSVRSHLPRAAARDVQAPVQWHILRGGVRGAPRCGQPGLSSGLSEWQTCSPNRNKLPRRDARRVHER